MSKTVIGFTVPGGLALAGIGFYIAPVLIALGFGLLVFSWKHAHRDPEKIPGF